MNVLRLGSMIGWAMKPSILFLILAAAATLIIGAKSVASPLLAALPLISESFDEDTGHSGDVVGENTLRRSQSPSLDDISPGNPLWAIPLETLSTTLERPLFSPSRRPPPLVVGAPHAPPPRRPLKPAEPERPPLTLVGTVVGKTDGFGIFIDTSTNAIVRLKTGGAFQGWLLRSVRGREVTLKKGNRITLLFFAAPSNNITNLPPQYGNQNSQDENRRAVSD
jgi:hypothetical protein